MAASRSLSRLLAGTAALLVSGSALTACGSGFEANRDGLVQALIDVTELTPEEAECVADSIEYTNDQGDDITSEVLEDLADGTVDTEDLPVTVEQFEEDLARAVADC